jgi:outer membrane lipoprotein-sorting protein
MFKDEADFEKIVGRLNIDTRPNPAHRETLRRRMLSVFNETAQQSQKRTTPLGILRRIIMKSKITKLAAAAVIIIAILIGVHYLGGSIDGASLAWAEVVEQISSYTKYKCRQRVVREQDPQYPTMQVYHLNLQQRRQEVEDGSIHIIDMRRTDAITVELYPAQNKATVTKLIGFGPRKDPHIIEMVKRFEQESTERLGTKKQNGKILHGFRHQPNKYNDYTVWVDPDTKLPVEIELKHTQRGQTIFLDEFEFDFELDPSAFSTDIPDGYDVKTIIHDYRPVESKEITAEDIRSGLNHTAYTVGKLPWIEKLIIMQVNSPLMRVGKVYLVGVVTDDDNNIIIDQSNVHSDYKEMIMEWILSEQLVMEAPSGARLYADPDGSEYARLNLESFAKANPEFFDMKNLSEERFTRMIVMPDGTVLGLVANKKMSNEKLQELVESLIEIKAN